MNASLFSSHRFRALLLCVLLGFGSHCFALISIEDVTKARAKELGVEVRLVQPGPKGARVELEFEATGPLKDFSRADLEIKDGEKWISSSLHEERKGTRIVVGFAADLDSLEKTTVRLVLREGGRAMSGCDFRVKNFVNLLQAR